MSAPRRGYTVGQFAELCDLIERATLAEPFQRQEDELLWTSDVARDGAHRIVAILGLECVCEEEGCEDGFPCLEHDAEWLERISRSRNRDVADEFRENGTCGVDGECRQPFPCPEHGIPARLFKAGT